MSKTNKSKSGSRSSRSRSASRSRSRSFSKSRSRSRSISRSRKRRLSSRSRSRSYSPAHNRERNHPRVYQNRDFRGHNRGYRRPYYFRGRNRGFYPWGQYNRGGYGNYRSNWQNYRQAYSPRRGRSRSRSPKRRSPSPRSRSHSRNSDKSSSDRSRRSSSSRSSSNHSRVEKRKSAKEKKSSSKDSRPSQAAGDNQGDEAKEQTFSGGASQDSKTSESSKQWPDAAPYGTGSASRASAVSELSPRERSPALKSPLQSVVVRRRSPRPSPVPKPSPPLSSSSQMGSTLSSGAGYQSGTHQGFDHGSGSLSPSKKSPVGKSPPATGSTYGSSQKEEGAASGGASYAKRYLDDQKTENGKDKEQKQTSTDKEKMKEKGNFSDTGLGDAKMKSDLFGPKTDSEKPFRGSQSPKRYKLRDDFEKKMTDFHKDDTDDQEKDKAKGRKESEMGDEPRFMSKVISGSNKSQEEEKCGKWEGLVYAPPGKEKQRKAEELKEKQRNAGLSRGAAAAAAPGMAAAPLLLLLLLVPVPLLPLLAQGPGGALGNRHAVYWNSSNQQLRREGYTVQVNVNDYLDIYCPHYNGSGVGPGAGPGPGGGAEQYVLYMVSRSGYRTCNASQGFKRWECNRPHAPHSPIKFSEKFQRYSAFSLGYEFHAGHEYYYISTPTHNLHWKCLRMKVFVCCASKDFEGENPQVPKLEKSISGTSPKREHLPLAVGIAFFLLTLLAS